MLFAKVHLNVTSDLVMSSPLISLSSEESWLISVVIQRHAKIMCIT